MLLAERFWQDARRGWIDLASAAPVDVRFGRAPSIADRASWLARCDVLSDLWHPAVIPLIDHGLLGDGRIFEVWPVLRTWSIGADRGIATLVRAAVRFLHSHDVAVGRAAWSRVHEFAGTPCLRPLTSADQPVLARHREVTTWDRLLRSWRHSPRAAVVGVRVQPRRALRWIVDVLSEVEPGALRWIVLRAQPGAGVGTMIGRVARQARLRGFVPLDAGLAASSPDIVGTLKDRHILLIERSPGLGPRNTDDLADVLLTTGLQSARARVALSIVHADSATGGATRVVDLDPLTVDQLVSMVALYPPGSISQSQLRRMAARAGGSPGRFVTLLQRIPRPPMARRPFVFRETAATYEATRTARPPIRPEDVKRIAACVCSARAFAERGLHAAAERGLRAAMQRFERRGCEREADETGLALARLVGERGRLRDANVLLDRVDRRAGFRTRVQAAILRAHLRIDEGRLLEAEAAARGASAAAQRCGDHESAPEAALAVARALFWQGRYDEAEEALTTHSPAAGDLLVRWKVRLARIAAARLNPTAAGCAVATAVEAAQASARPELCVRAWATTATVRSMVGDVHGFREGMRQALVALPDAHRPLLALRVRLAHADGCDRLGLRSELRLVAGRLRRWQRRPLPALLCARIQAALASAGDGSAHGATERFVRTTGARGIVRSVTEGLNMNALQELSDVLHICHESPDDLTALSQVCVVLRERMRAAAVFAVSEIADHQVLAGAGRTAGSAPETAARAMATGQPIAAALTDAGIEAAAPVRYAGRTIGAIACRWAIDAEVDHQRVTAALATVAAACAPSLRAAIDRLSTPAPPPPGNQAFIGCSSAIQVVRQAVMRAAQAPFAVLVEGESGSGKELVARAVHAQGPRRDRRFCAVNCAALTDELLEAELFGHARGAFTGAVSERAGVFEEADRGTLLLDEVSELSARAQAKLLRAIQEGEIRRVGENLPRRVDVRLIAASNRALATEVAAGRFRADLRYRLDVIRVVVPPLRERVEDIPLLAVHFWNHAIERTNSRATLDPDTLAALARYDWPGNVRELQNVMAALAVQAGPRGRVGARALPAHIAGRAPAGGAATLEEARHAFERRFVRETLARAGGHSGRAARALGISRQGLAKLVRRLGLDAARSANGPDTAVSDASAAGARIEPIP